MYNIKNSDDDYHKYVGNVKDEFMEKKHSNYIKSLPWTHVKNNTKTNKFKKKNNNTSYKSDPYKFLEIPSNIKKIIFSLCESNNISLQMLAIKINMPLHIIDNYLNNNYPLDNYDLHKILNYFNFDLKNHITNLKNSS